MTRTRTLSRKKQRKISEIKHALAQSDTALHDHMVSLDTFERTARSKGDGYVSPQWVRTLEKIQNEKLRAAARLRALDTGLRAQDDLRRALTASAAGFGAYARALGSSDPAQIAAAGDLVRRSFQAAATHGERGLSRLERGV